MVRSFAVLRSDPAQTRVLIELWVLQEKKRNQLKGLCSCPGNRSGLAQGGVMERRTWWGRMTPREETGGALNSCPRAMEVSVPGLRVQERGRWGLDSSAGSARTPRLGNGFRWEPRAADRNWGQKRGRARAREI